MDFSCPCELLLGYIHVCIQVHSTSYVCIHTVYSLTSYRQLVSQQPLSGTSLQTTHTHTDACGHMTHPGRLDKCPSWWLRPQWTAGSLSAPETTREQRQALHHHGLCEGHTSWCYFVFTLIIRQHANCSCICTRYFGVKLFIKHSLSSSDVLSSVCLICLNQVLVQPNTGLRLTSMSHCSVSAGHRELNVSSDTESQI